MQKRVWKSVLSIVLVLTLAVLTVLPSLAAVDKPDANPILIVSGFTEYVLQNTETGEKLKLSDIVNGDDDERRPRRAAGRVERSLWRLG